MITKNIEKDYTSSFVCAAGHFCVGLHGATFATLLL